MNKKTSKASRKSNNRIGDILASMNTKTTHLTPIFGTEASPRCSFKMLFKNFYCDI